MTLLFGGSTICELLISPDVNPLDITRLVSQPFGRWVADLGPPNAGARGATPSESSAETGTSGGPLGQVGWYFEPWTTARAGPMNAGVTAWFRRARHGVVAGVALARFSTSGPFHYGLSTRPDECLAAVGLHVANPPVPAGSGAYCVRTARPAVPYAVLVIDDSYTDVWVYGSAEDVRNGPLPSGVSPSDLLNGT